MWFGTPLNRRGVTQEESPSSDEESTMAGGGSRDSDVPASLARGGANRVAAGQFAAMVQEVARLRNRMSALADTAEQLAQLNEQRASSVSRSQSVRNKMRSKISCILLTWQTPPLSQSSVQRSQRVVTAGRRHLASTTAPCTEQGSPPRRLPFGSPMRSADATPENESLDEDEESFVVDEETPATTRPRFNRRPASPHPEEPSSRRRRVAEETEVTPRTDTPAQRVDGKLFSFAQVFAQQPCSADVEICRNHLEVFVLSESDQSGMSRRIRAKHPRQVGIRCSLCKGKSGEGRICPKDLYNMKLRTSADLVQKHWRGGRCEAPDALDVINAAKNIGNREKWICFEGTMDMAGLSEVGGMVVFNEIVNL